MEAAERRSNLLYHPVGEIFLLGIAAHVLEWQHGDGGLIGKRERLSNFDRSSSRRCRRSILVDPRSPRAHWLGNILQVLRTDIFKGDIDLAADLTLRVVGDADAAGLRDP